MHELKGVALIVFIDTIHGVCLAAPTAVSAQIDQSTHGAAAMITCRTGAGAMKKTMLAAAISYFYTLLLYCRTPTFCPEPHHLPLCRPFRCPARICND